MSKKAQIFLASHPTSWQTMAKLAEALQEKGGDFYPVVVVTERLSHYLAWCHERKILCYSFNGNLLAPKNGSSETAITSPAATKSFPLSAAKLAVRRLYGEIQDRLSRFEESRAGRICRASSLYCVFRAILEFFGIRIYMKGCLNLLDQLKPDAIYIHADALGNVFAAFFAECKKRKVTLVRAPTAYYEPHTSASRRTDDYLSVNSLAGAPWINYLLRLAHPTLFYTYRRKTVMFYQPWESLALIFSGCLPKDPWYMGKSFADVVCVEDETTARRYQSWGVEKDKIVVAGHVDLDVVSRSKLSMTRETFCEMNGLDPNKKTVGIALPQLFEHGVVPSWDAHWQEIGFILEGIPAEQFNLIGLFHPKADRENYRFLKEKYGCHIFNKETAHAIPFLDLLITAGSSTCQWAAQCGIPVINLGYFAWTVDQFRYLEAVTTVETRQDYIDSLRLLKQDDSYYRSLWEKAVAGVANFPPLDAHNRDRILSSKQYVMAHSKHDLSVSSTSSRLQ